MKTFVVIPTRNDAWVLRPVLATVSLWADHIIVADENSWDATPEICKEFPKVRYINFQPKEFNESNRRQVLLEAVREHDGQNLVFGLDSDEILTAEVLNPDVFANFLGQMKPGMSAKLQWIMLWKNAHQYRYDVAPEWSANFKHFAYWDDRKIKFENVRMHSSRVPEFALKNSITFSGFKVVHYAFADWQRMLAKHVYYLALEKIMGSTRHPYVLDRKYHWFEKVKSGELVLKDLPKQWFSEYEQQGVMPLDFQQESFYWYDAEVLRFFQKFGVKYFQHLNIWNTNWEEKRKQALAKGEKDLPKDQIINQLPFYDFLFYKFIAPIFYQY